MVALVYDVPMLFMVFLKYRYVPPICITFLRAQRSKSFNYIHEQEELSRGRREPGDLLTSGSLMVISATASSSPGLYSGSISSRAMRLISVFSISLIFPRHWSSHVRSLVEAMVLLVVVRVSYSNKEYWLPLWNSSSTVVTGFSGRESKS